MSSFIYNLCQVIISSKRDTSGDDLSFTHHTNDLALISPRIQVRKVSLILWKINCPLTLKKKLSNSSVDCERDLYNVDKITDFPLSFISNIYQTFNHDMLRTLNVRQLLHLMQTPLLTLSG